MCWSLRKTLTTKRLNCEYPRPDLAPSRSLSARPPLSRTVFPAYFIGRAKRCWELAKSMRDPALAQTFVERANVLRNLAISGKGAARNGQASALRPGIVQPKAKTQSALRRELHNLSPGMSLALQASDFLALSTRDAWHECRRLAEEFGCQVEFRPDGRIWFVKRD